MMKILRALILFIVIFGTMLAPVSSFEDPCADGSCNPPDPCADGSCEPVCDEKFLDSYRCSGNDRQRLKLLSECTQAYVKVETCAYGCDAATAACKPAPKCEPKYLDTYRCSGSQREILELQSDCTTQKYVPIGEPCSYYGCDEISAPTQANPERKLAFCVSPPPVILDFDSLPSASISLPPSAAPGSQLSIVVSGNDDRDVAQLLLYNGSSNLLETFDCVGIQTSCSVVFTKAAPAARSTPYAFKARSKDSAGQFSGFVSATGTTTAAPVVPPVVPPPVVPPVVPPPAALPPVPKPLQVVSIKFPLQPLFLRALNFPDSDCVRPGESALLAVKVQNTAKSALKDVSFAATVPELGIRAGSGPIKLAAKDKSTRLLRIDVPQGAKENTYYLRFTISNNKFKRTVHRTFVVDSSC